MPMAIAIYVLFLNVATAAAFGIAGLVFQNGALEQLLGFESQGFRGRVGADLLLRPRVRAVRAERQAA